MLESTIPAHLQLPQSDFAPAIDEPPYIPAEGLSATVPPRALQIPLSAQAVAMYRDHPVQLMNDTFINDGSEVFKVTHVMMRATGEQLYYVVFGGQGYEAYLFTADDLFSMLQSSKQVYLPTR